MTDKELERIRDEAREADEGEWMEAADLADHLFDKADAQHIENCSPDRVEAWAQEILEWRVLAENGMGCAYLDEETGYVPLWEAGVTGNVIWGQVEKLLRESGYSTGDWPTLDEARAALAQVVRCAKTGRDE